MKNKISKCLYKDTIDSLKNVGVTRFTLADSVDDVRSWLHMNKNTIINVTPVRRMSKSEYGLKFRHNVYVMSETEVKNFSVNEPVVYYKSYDEALEAGILCWCRYTS